MSDLIFHHIGIACRNIEEEIPYYKALGYTVAGEEFQDENQGIKGLFMENSGSQIELLEAWGENSPLHSFLDRGIQMYHQGFLCSNVIDTSLEFVENGAMVISEPKSAKAFKDRFVTFLMLPNRMIIELIGPIS